MLRTCDPVRLRLLSVRKISRRDQSRNSLNRRSAEIHLRGDCSRSRKHKCIADAGSIRRSAIACKTDTGEGIARDYPVIFLGAALRRRFKQHWKLSLYLKEDLAGD